MTTSRALDRRVHRCACGAWCYGDRPCTVCGRLGTGAPAGVEFAARGRGCAVCGVALRPRDEGELCPSCRDQLAIPVVNTDSRPHV